MRLSLVFELLLIFVLIAFAASRVIESKGSRTVRSISARKHVKQAHKNRQEDAANKYCSCSSKLCNCCREFHIPVVSFKGPGCASLQYLRDDKLAISMSFGDRILTNTTVDSRKPKPVCMPLPGGVTKFCGRVYNIGRHGEDFNACLGLELRSVSDLEASLRVSCFRFGPRGLKVEPPQPLPLITPTNEEDDDDDDDDDDEFDLGDVDDEIDEIDEFDDDDDDDDDEDGDEDDDDNNVDSAEYDTFSVLDDDFDIDNIFEEESGGSSSYNRRTTAAPPPLRRVTRRPLRPIQRKPVTRRTVTTTTAKPTIKVTKLVTKKVISTTPKPLSRKPTTRKPTIKHRTRRPLRTTTLRNPLRPKRPIRTTSRPTRAPVKVVTKLNTTPLPLTTTTKSSTTVFSTTPLTTTAIPSTSTTTTTTTTTTTEKPSILQNEINVEDNIVKVEDSGPVSQHASIAAVTAMLQDIPGESIPQVEMKPTPIIQEPVRLIPQPETTMNTPTEKEVEAITEIQTERMETTQQTQLSDLITEASSLETTTFNERFETTTDQSMEDEDEDDGPVQSFILKDDEESDDESGAEDEEEREVTTEAKIADGVKPETKDVLSDIIDGVVETFEGEDSEESTKTPGTEAINDDDEDEDDEESDEKENDDDEGDDLLGDDDDDDEDDEEEEDDDDDDDEFGGRKAKQHKLKGRIRQSRDMWLDRLHW